MSLGLSIYDFQVAGFKCEPHVEFSQNDGFYVSKKIRLFFIKYAHDVDDVKELILKLIKSRKDNRIEIN